MLPASKVSVPFAVVMRTRSRTPDKASDPAVDSKEVPSLLANVPFAAHVFPVTNVNTVVPCKMFVAVALGYPKPVVKLETEGLAPEAIIPAPK